MPIQSSKDILFQQIQQLRNSLGRGMSPAERANIQAQIAALESQLNSASGVPGSSVPGSLPATTSLPQQGIVPPVQQTNHLRPDVSINLPNTPGNVFDPNNPTLPPNPTFEDIARYEEAKRNLAGKEFQGQIGKLRTGVQGEYDKALGTYQSTSAARRAALASSLSENAKKTFEMNNPYILEDLNARGVFTSPTAVSQAQAQALKELELGNQENLLNFDTTTRTYEDQLAAQRLKDLQELDLAGTSVGIQSQQDALDAALDLRRSSLQNNLQEAQAAREEQLARDLARQQKSQGIIQSLIGAGGSILGAGLMGGFGGGGGGGGTPLGRLFGGGSGAASFGSSGGQIGPQTAAQAGYRFGPGGTLLNTAGTSNIGLGSVGGGLLGYQLGRTAFRPTQAGDRGAQNVGAAIGGVGGSFFGPAGSALGSFLGSAVGKAQNRLQKGAEKSFGGTVGSIVKYAQPTTAIASIGNKVKKAFCFDKDTPVTMADGSHRAICRLYLGAETEGGVVESIRTSKMDDGTRYNYKGVTVTGSHAVLEDGKWLRVQDSTYATPVNGGGTVWSIVTTDHRIKIGDITFADEAETDYYEDLSIDESLDYLNGKEVLVEAR